MREAKFKRLLAQPLQYGANESADSADLDNPRYIRITDIQANGTLSNATFRSLTPDVAKDYLLREGDLLLARSGATVGKSYLHTGYKGQACFAGYLLRATPNKLLVLPKYLAYFAQSTSYWDAIFAEQIQATIPNFNAEKYGELRVPLPKLDHQERLIEHLDTKTAAIDALIAKKELLIEELRKYQEAVIAEAVAPREGWVRMKLKQCVATKISTGVGKPGTEFNEGDPRYLRTTDIESLFNLKSDSIRTLPAADVVGAEVMRDDILFTTAGSVGKTYHHSVDGEFCYAGFLARVRLKESHYSRYFAYLLSSRWVQDIVDQYKVTSTIDNFSASKLGDVGICIPSLEGQKCIASKIDQLLISSSRILENAQLALQSLKDLRSSIISEAVTGKLPLPADIQ